jgi:hypothetical protein
VLTGSLEQLDGEVQALVRDFLAALEDVLGETLVGLYLFVALTFPDSRDTAQDIDFHLIVRRPLDPVQREGIEGLRRRMAAEHRLGNELDGYCIALADTMRLAPPRHQLWPLSAVPADFAWALHCAHLRAGRAIVVRGPDPREIYPAPEWADLEAALFSEIQFVRQHLADAPAYCVLNACRLLYSFTTREVVVSKRAAADWVLQEVPELQREMIEAALHDYDGNTSERDRALLTRDVCCFTNAIWGRIAGEEAGTRVASPG